MPAVLDIAALAEELRQTTETLVEQKALEGVNPYLLETILPMLERGDYPCLRDIDFDQFELYDPPGLAGYIQERGQREYQLTQLNKPLCGLSPVCVKKRAFL